uniref:Uncharacterized protein n=1 Tax=Neogobius melanostomus TaxID=47308 RepID=A0A8C6S7E5_9GOBI
MLEVSLVFWFFVTIFLGFNYYYLEMDVEREAERRPLSTLSAFSYIPPTRTGPREMSYYNREPQTSEMTMFDRVYNQREGFDMKLLRDDRSHWKGRGLDIYNEVFFPFSNTPPH